MKRELSLLKSSHNALFNQQINELRDQKNKIFEIIQENNFLKFKLSQQNKEFILLKNKFEKILNNNKKYNFKNKDIIIYLKNDFQFYNYSFNINNLNFKNIETQFISPIYQHELIIQKIKIKKLLKENNIIKNLTIEFIQNFQNLILNLKNNLLNNLNNLKKFNNFFNSTLKLKINSNILIFFQKDKNNYLNYLEKIKNLEDQIEIYKANERRFQRKIIKLKRIIKDKLN